MTSPVRTRRLTALLTGALALVLATAVSAPVTAAPGPDDTTVDHPADATTVGAIPDSASGCLTDGVPREVAIPVAGVSQRITGVAVGVTMSHTWVGDLTMTLVAPSGEEFVLLSRTGRVTATSCGESSNVGGAYVFSDDAEAEWWATAVPLDTGGVVPEGSYRTSAPGGLDSTGAPTLMSPAFAAATASGTWTLRVTDGGNGDTGAITDAFLRLTVDTTAPNDTAITAGPASGARLASAPSYTVSSVAEDLAGFVCSVDAGPAAPCASPVTPAVQPGAHTFSVAAVDTSGNVDSTPEVRTFVLRDLPCEAATAKVAKAKKALAGAKKALKKAKKSGKPAKVAKAKKKVKQKAKALKTAKAKQRGSC